MRRSGLLALVLAGISATAAATTAIAADLPVAPVPYVAPAYRPALYDWTGFYLGFHIGAGILSDKVAEAAAAPTTPIIASTNLNPFGFLGGGQIGANYEMAPWVVGFEGTWTWSDISGSGIVATTTAGTTERATSAPKWLATATGRFGYAANDVLFYAKGGAAWMRADYDQDLLISTVTSTQGLTDTRSGFTVGGGIEWAFTENLSAKVEYDFLDFGTRTYNFVQTPVSIKSELNVFTAGLNYRFNWGGGGTVAARY